MSQITRFQPKIAGVKPRTARFTTTRCSSQPGDKLLPLLRSPVDLLFLPGRLAAGTLTSLPDVFQQLPSDLERLTSLLSDPRPIEARQAELLEQLENRVATYVEKGSRVEDEVLESVSAALPQEVKDALPAELKDLLDQRKRTRGTSTSTSQQQQQQQQWTFSSSMEGNSDDDYRSIANRNGSAMVMMNSDDEEAAMMPMPSPQEIASSQLASELVAGQAAVLAVKARLGDVAGNTDVSKDGMLKLNLREARGNLAGWLEQLAPESRRISEPPIADAVNEAEDLLAEVDKVM